MADFSQLACALMSAGTARGRMGSSLGDRDDDERERKGEALYLN